MVVAPGRLLFSRFRSRGRLLRGRFRLTPGRCGVGVRRHFRFGFRFGIGFGFGFGFGIGFGFGFGIGIRIGIRTGDRFRFTVQGSAEFEVLTGELQHGLRGGTVLAGPGRDVCFGGCQDFVLHCRVGHRRVLHRRVVRRCFVCRCLVPGRCRGVRCNRTGHNRRGRRGRGRRGCRPDGDTGEVHPQALEQDHPVSQRQIRSGAGGAGGVGTGDGQAESVGRCEAPFRPGGDLAAAQVHRAGGQVHGEVDLAAQEHLDGAAAGHDREPWEPGEGTARGR